MAERVAGPAALGNTMHPLKRARPDSDVGRCEAMEKLVGEQRSDEGPHSAGLVREGARSVLPTG